MWKLAIVGTALLDFTVVLPNYEMYTAFGDSWYFWLRSQLNENQFVNHVNLF